MKKILTVIIIGAGLVGVLNYLPHWLDRRGNNTTPMTGAAKFFAELKSKMFNLIPIQDEIGITQNLIWFLIFSLAAWLILRKTKL